MENTMKRYIFLAGFILASIINVVFSYNIVQKNSEFYSNEIKLLLNKNSELQNKLTEFNKYGIKVTVTMYRPTKYETDNTPDITADGTKIKIHKASEYKFVALSRNLLKRWGGILDYGDFILLKGTTYKDGVYQVKDTMNSKWVNVVDILESPGTKPYKFTNVDIYKLNWN